MTAESPEAPEAGRAPQDERRGARWTGDDWLALFSVTAIAAVMRLYNLTIPQSLVFDEAHYARHACWYTYASARVCNLDGAPTEVHPPLGNEMIASGIQLFGYNAFGWRIAGVVAGVATVVFTYLLARRLLGSTLGAVLAAGLLAFDPLHFVQSRTAMLDIFVPFCATAAFLFIVYDRDRYAAELEASARDPEVRGPPRFKRPWRWAAALAAGAATSVKWSGALVVAGVFVLAVAWVIGMRRRQGGLGWRQTLGAFVRKDALSIVVILGLVPLLTYVVLYLYRIDGGFFMDPFKVGSWYYNFVEQHRFMGDFHFGLPSHHPWESPPWSWFLLKRPVAYFFETTTDGQYREILGTGNPFVWWPSLVAVAYLAWVWVRNRIPTRPEGAILGMWAFSFLPWVLLSRNRPAVFLFYMLPVLPFIALSLAWVGTRIKAALTGKIAIALFAAGAVATFFFYYPILTTTPISADQWKQRIWIFDNCDPHPEEVARATQTGRGQMRRAQEEGKRPPLGWCWI